MIWHSSSVTDIEAKMGTSVEKGMSSDDVKKKLDKYGKNIIEIKNKKSFFAKFLEQLKDTMVIILMIAAVVSAVVTTLEGKNDWIEPIIIVAIVIVNALLGVIQESRAENALEALKSMTTPSAKVIRDGVKQTIDAADLVPGDIITFEAGDYIPADARLVEAYSLFCDESMLTGESLPVEKEAGSICEDITPIAERRNMIYSGCSVSNGRGKAIVTETGAFTEMGKIAVMIKQTDSSITPLQHKLAALGKSLGIISLVICAVIFVFGKFVFNQGLIEMFMTAVSLAVAAIPEGLPAIVTIVLAMGVQRMVKQNAIIRRLPAVETLGSASVICSDKTGTLTQNRMTLTCAYVNGKTEIFNPDAVSPELLAMLRLAALCCDGTAELTENGVWKHIGDPTETAIVKAAVQSLKTDKKTLDLAYPRMAELPFDSDRKLMTVVCVIEGKPYSITKGGMDVLLERCPNVDKKAVEKANLEMAKQGLRVLAVAIKPLESVPSNPTVELLENDLNFLGLIGMIDPPREEVKASIDDCYSAGIRTVMITGDHVITAAAIAHQLGIMREGDIAVTGAQLDEMSDEELDEKLEHICVYARVSPENKLRIVNAWKAKKQVVAMTGDGVNDAPALKAADIGCAMGITGTDVAKGAAAMTLTDDNFATIVTAVKEGRGIFENIRKSVHFLLSCNFGEILTVFFGLMIFRTTPLTPILLLWLNLVTDSLPALALGFEPAERGIMKEPPRAKDESILARGLGINSLWQGVMFGVITLIAYHLGLTMGGSKIYARSMAFAVLSLSQLVHAMNCRSEHSLFVVGWFKNVKLLLADLISFILVAAVQFIPFLRDVFGLAKLNAAEYGWIAILSLSPLVICELVKAVFAIIRKFKPDFMRGGKIIHRGVRSAEEILEDMRAQESDKAENSADTAGVVDDKSNASESTAKADDFEDNSEDKSDNSPDSEDDGDLESEKDNGESSADDDKTADSEDENSAKPEDNGDLETEKDNDEPSADDDKSADSEDENSVEPQDDGNLEAKKDNDEPSADDDKSADSEDENSAKPEDNGDLETANENDEPSADDDKSADSEDENSAEPEDSGNLETEKQKAPEPVVVLFDDGGEFDDLTANAAKSDDDGDKNVRTVDGLDFSDETTAPDIR